MLARTADLVQTWHPSRAVVCFAPCRQHGQRFHDAVPSRKCDEWNLKVKESVGWCEDRYWKSAEGATKGQLDRKFDDLLRTIECAAIGHLMSSMRSFSFSSNVAVIQRCRRRASWWATFSFWSNLLTLSKAIVGSYSYDVTSSSIRRETLIVTFRIKTNACCVGFTNKKSKFGVYDKTNKNMCSAEETKADGYNQRENRKKKHHVMQITNL